MSSILHLVVLPPSFKHDHEEISFTHQTSFRDLPCSQNHFKIYYDKFRQQFVTETKILRLYELNPIKL